MERRGTFIVIEGSDGSGKATQFQLVKERLELAGHQVETFDFPQYDKPSSYFVKRYLDGAYGGPDDVGPYTGSLFYALDRFEAAPKIRQALSDGKIVLCNRFTGSNMAHQGSKIANAEQRRGFFIWLDNLEFEMLRIPRPDVSFILRVPAETSQKLMANKETHDIHEVDLLHLQRTVTVFDDMAQLFPKDFQRVDCVRSGQLLDIQTIQAMLWEKINPILPPPAAKVAAASVQSEPVEAAAKPETVKEEPVVKELLLEGASGLLVEKIERVLGSVQTRQSRIPSFYTPVNLVPDAKKAYEAKAEILLGLYAKVAAGLVKRGMSDAEARRAAMPALMVATTANVRVAADDPRLEELIVTLMNDDLAEAQAAGATLFAQAIKIDSGRFKNASKPIKRDAAAAVRALAEEFLAENHIGEQPPVQLTAVWPRNEIDLVADMLYEHSSLPLRTIQDRIATWPLSRKLAVFEAYIGDGEAGTVLQKAHYSWDLQAPYSVFRELQCGPVEALAIQQLTPRYGYDIPEVIEDAGLSDAYEKCFDLSLELYSTLQQAGHHQEAQYATLYGHNQRFKMTQNALQAASTQKSGLTTGTTQLISSIREKITEVHPIVAESI